MSAVTAEAKPVKDDLEEVDRDSLHTLPLKIVPLRLAALRRARMIKTSKLESVIELFKDSSAGSGLIDIKSLPDFIQADEADIAADLEILHPLADLNSFDVFSLRNSLRDLKIDVRSATDLQLSPAMEGRLTEYMKSFTRPLVTNVFGTPNDAVESSGQIIHMFTNIDRDVALRNMRKIAQMMGITIVEIPAFLEKYGDIYLSLPTSGVALMKSFPSSISSPSGWRRSRRRSCATTVSSWTSACSSTTA